MKKIQLSKKEIGFIDERLRPCACDADQFTLGEMMENEILRETIMKKLKGEK